MNFLNNEKGVSELIGALLILLILVIVLGSIQVYEVPKWNKELEKQNFDIASAEFIDMKSNLEDVSIYLVPKTSNLHMGVKYPERFMLRNPTPAYGTLSNYPLNITANITLIDPGGNITYNETRYTSYGIEYRLNGLSNFPKLVYEHGLIIKDFEKVNMTDTKQSLLIGNEFFIPIIDGNSIILSSAGTESLSFNPMIMSIFNETNSATGLELNISRIDITMDTKYNKIWNETFNDTNVRIEGNKIKISVPGSSSYSRKYFAYPNPSPEYGSINSGMLMFTSNLQALRGAAGAQGLPGGGSGSNDGIQGIQGPAGANGTQGERGQRGGLYGVPSGPTEPEGAYTNERASMNWINLPTSNNATKFSIEDLNVAQNSGGSYISFVVTDIKSKTFYVEIQLGNANPPTSASVFINKANKPSLTVPIAGGVAGEMNLTSYYKNASIGYPNSLVVVNWESPSTTNIDSKILYFKYTIR